MYEQQIKSIEEKIKDLSSKAKLKKTPRMKRFKGPLPSAYYFGRRNELGISDTMLKEWQEGLRDEQDVDATLAHEVGHAISHQQKSHYYRRVAIHSMALIPMVIVFVLRAFIFSAILQSLVLAALLISFIIWVFCLPWVVRTAYIPSELEADSNAVDYGLVIPKQLIRQMVRAANVSPSTGTSPLQTWAFMWNVLKHPSMGDRLRNLSCRIENVSLKNDG
jgi:Zn-dependent protease with chaperone function